MLKLIHAFDMNYDNVLEYYHSFAQTDYSDIESYAVMHVIYGEKEYIDYIFNYCNDLYYLVDDANEEYIIGFGVIIDSKVLDCHKNYDVGKWKGCRFLK